MRNGAKLIGAILVCELVGVAGAFFTASAIRSHWYAALLKPTLTPPPWVFGSVWIALYALMGIAWWVISRQSNSTEKRYALMIFAIQLVLNAAWSPVFFGAHAVRAAFFVIVMLWIAVVAMIIAARRVSLLAAWILVPYLLWMTWALYLNYALWHLNPEMPREGVACTQEEKICPDGSVVHPIGQNCKFAACPDVTKFWKIITDPKTGATFKYPESFSTTYLYPIDWPPAVQIIHQAFTCKEAGSEFGRAGETRRRVIKGMTFCVTKESEGAAGSIYTHYAYAFGVHDNTVILTFSTRRVQCANYEAPTQQICEGERNSFDLDGLLDEIAQHLTFSS
ncbi:MAG: tryptophan-rich sensory protein [Patescibacteria group bacterium]|nr:tryptophan-rich sensory protein [Patescibacteria group bacterium]MDE2438637.1 tryptophan-rich sensory protein [Patescibacteria group bacterium]